MIGRGVVIIIILSVRPASIDIKATKLAEIKVERTRAWCGATSKIKDSSGESVQPESVLAWIC